MLHTNYWTFCLSSIAACPSNCDSCYYDTDDSAVVCNSGGCKTGYGRKTDKYCYGESHDSIVATINWIEQLDNMSDRAVVCMISYVIFSSYPVSNKLNIYSSYINKS